RPDGAVPEALARGARSLAAAAGVTMAAEHAGADAFAAGMLRWFENHSAQGLFTTDQDLLIRSWNRWLTTATGLEPDAVIGKPLMGVIPSLVERGLDSYYRDALDGQPKVLSHTLHRYLVPCPQPDGGMMPQSARIAPLMDGDTILGTITVVGDVGERVSA